jgi:hypothetical protein
LGGEFASDHNITAEVEDIASTDDMVDARTIEILI